MPKPVAFRLVLTQLQIALLACAQLEGQLHSAQVEQFQSYAECRARSYDANIDFVWTAIASEVGDDAPAIAARLLQMAEYVRAMIDELVERIPEAKGAIAECVQEARIAIGRSSAITIREQLDAVERKFDHATHIYESFAISEADARRWAAVARTKALSEVRRDFGIYLGAYEQAKYERDKAREYARLARQKQAKLRAEAAAHQEKKSRAYDRQILEWRSAYANYEAAMSVWSPKNSEWKRRAKRAVEERQKISSRIKAVGDEQNLNHRWVVISFRAMLILASLMVFTITPLLLRGWFSATFFVGGPLCLLTVLSTGIWWKLNEERDGLASELSKLLQRLQELDIIVRTVATEKPTEPARPAKPQRPDGYVARNAGTAVFGDRG